jgi:hypothetical protein
LANRSSLIRNNATVFQKGRGFFDKGTTVIRNKMTVIYNIAAILQIEAASSAIIPAIFGYKGAEIRRRRIGTGASKGPTDDRRYRP